MVPCIIEDGLADILLDGFTSGKQMVLYEDKLTFLLAVVFNVTKIPIVFNSKTFAHEHFGYCTHIFVCHDLTYFTLTFLCIEIKRILI